MENMQVIFAFVISLSFVLVTIIKFKQHPFLALIIGGFVMGGLSGLELLDIVSGITGGFGNTMAGIGILVILGVVLGDVLHKSGCMENIANVLLDKLGKKKTPLAINLTGYIVSIPVFFDAAFVILINLVKALAASTGIPFVTLTMSLAIGLVATHGMVAPTPGPTLVAATMGANLGWFIFYGIIVSIFSSYLGGVVYGRYLGKQKEFKELDKDILNHEDNPKDVVESKAKKDAPSGGLGIALILFPIVLILIGSVVTTFVPETHFAYSLFGFIGDKNVAVLISAIVAFIAVKDSLNDSLNDIIVGAIDSSASILAITGAGGAFGAIIQASGIADVVVDLFAGASGTSSWLIIIFAYLVSSLLRVAQGSTTVALVTTSAIFAPIVVGMPDVSPVLVGLAMCAGGINVSLPNDSGFWIMNRFGGLTVSQTFKTWTVGCGIVSLASFLTILVLNLLTGVLPGIMG